MKFARITDQEASAALAVLVDVDVSAVQEEESMAREIAEIDALLESADRELAADERTELVRVSRDVTDQVRARRARRRADREVLRALPVRVRGEVSGWFDGEAA